MKRQLYPSTCTTADMSVHFNLPAFMAPSLILKAPVSGVLSFSGPVPSYGFPVIPGLLFPTFKLTGPMFDDLVI